MTFSDDKLKQLKEDIKIMKSGSLLFSLDRLYHFDSLLTRLESAEAVKATEGRLHYEQINLARVAGKLEGFTACRERAEKIAEHHPCCAGSGCALSVEIAALRPEEGTK